LLQLEIQEPLRFAERTVDGLVQILARPRLRIAPEINADKPGTLAARNDLPCFSGHSNTSWLETGTQLAHLCGGDQVLSGSERDVIDKGNSVPDYSNLISGALEAIS
jgi:hypothetical protein